MVSTVLRRAISQGRREEARKSSRGCATSRAEIAEQDEATRTKGSRDVDLDSITGSGIGSMSILYSKLETSLMSYLIYLGYFLAIDPGRAV